MDIKYKLYRLKYVLAKSLKLKTPIDVTLELSSFCNQRCGYCYHANQDTLPFNRGHMSLETAQRIIDSCYDAGVNSLKFNWRGESTLNPMFSEILDYARKKARGMVFIDRITNTNLNYDSKQIHITEALAHQTLVKASIDSFYKPIMDKQRAGSNLFKSIANLYWLWKNRNRKCKVVLQAVRTNLNKTENHKLFLDRSFKGISLSVRDMVDGRGSNDCSSNTVREKGSERQACHQAFYRVVFDWNGNAFPCCNDIAGYFHLGNINQMSVRDIFNCDKYKQLRKDLKSGVAYKFNPCKNCPSYESFKGWKPAWNP